MCLISTRFTHKFQIPKCGHAPPRSCLYLRALRLQTQPTKIRKISKNTKNGKEYEIWTSIELNIQNSKFRPALPMVTSRLDEDQNPHFKEFKSIGANTQCYSTRKTHSRVYSIFGLSYSTELENPNILTRFTSLNQRIPWGYNQ